MFCGIEDKEKYDKSIESSYLTYLGANNLHGWAMSRKLPINIFKWENDVSKFNEDFKKNYNENSDEGYLVIIKTYHYYLIKKN